MAVDRRAVATVGPGRAYRVSTPGYSGDEPHRIVDAVTGGARPDCTIDLDSTAFSDNGNKVGIGSSAALTVALSAAFEKSTDVLEKSLAAHSDLQGGTGSGVDIAAAVYGGLIEYGVRPRQVRPLEWPDDLAFRVIWTGVPASTEVRLQKLGAQAATASRSALLLVAPRVAEAWRSGDTGAILSEYIPYIGVLRQFSVDHDLGIFDAGHDELTDAAMVNGLLYKPAGAGGGDIGILFGRSEIKLDAFVEIHSDLVHGVLTCKLDPEGVRLERP